MTFCFLRERYREIYDAVKNWHEIAPRKHRGHGLDHDVTVAMLGVHISPNQHVAEMAFVTGLLHSTDRTMEKGDEGLVEKIDEFLSFLPEGRFAPEEVLEIRSSVLHHAELNNPHQPLVQQILMDADRLANLQPAVIMRAGQYREEYPTLELNFLYNANPESTYHNPKSVLDSLRGCIGILEVGNIGYIEQLRLPKARVLGIEYASELLKYIRSIQQSYEMLGLSNVKL